MSSEEADLLYGLEKGKEQLKIKEPFERWSGRQLISIVLPKILTHLPPLMSVGQGPR